MLKSAVEKDLKKQFKKEDNGNTNLDDDHGGSVKTKKVDVQYNINMKTVIGKVQDGERVKMVSFISNLYGYI